MNALMPLDQAALVTRVQSLFDAERSLRTLHDELAEADTATLLTVFRQELDAAKALSDENEVELRLTRLAVILGHHKGDAVIDLLIDLLDSSITDARLAAGEVLVDLAIARYKEVAAGIERAIGRLPKGSLAIRELPYVLAGVIAESSETGAFDLITKFLKHEDGDTVAGAIEVLVDIGDPKASALLLPLERDARIVQMEDAEGGESGSATIGELAKEGRRLLNPTPAKSSRRERR